MKYFITLLLMFSFLVWGCSLPTPVDELYNKAASVNASDSLVENPLLWNVLTSLINRKDSTMATLYGNDSAVNYARHHADGKYGAGTKLALITWRQQSDPHWFGGKIPGNIARVELIVFDKNNTPQYNMYAGKSLRKVAQQDTQRLATILSYRAAVMPDF